MYMDWSQIHFPVLEAQELVLVPQGQGSVFGTNPYTYENQQVNISLDVLPRVNDADVIMMKIDAMVQDIIGFIGHDQRPMISTG